MPEGDAAPDAWDELSAACAELRQAMPAHAPNVLARMSECETALRDGDIDVALVLIETAGHEQEVAMECGLPEQFWEHIRRATVLVDGLDAFTSAKAEEQRQLEAYQIYEKLAASGATPKEVYARMLCDSLPRIKRVSVIRTLFHLSLAEAIDIDVSAQSPE